MGDNGIQDEKKVDGKEKPETGGRLSPAEGPGQEMEDCCGLCVFAENQANEQFLKFQIG